MKKNIHSIINYVLFSLVIVSALLLSPSLKAHSEDIQKPVIHLTYVPEYGSFDDIEGYVYCDDGTSFNPADYRVALYIEIDGLNQIYQKPTYDQPFVPIAKNGYFRADYTTGGIDEQAIIIHLLLVDSDYAGDYFYSTKEKAFDYVRVDRTSDGKITVSPDRQVAEKKALANAEKVAESGTSQADGTKGTAVKSSGLVENAEKIGVNIGFYPTKPQGSALTTKEINKILDAAAEYADTIRIYSSAGPEKKAYPLAKKKGLKVIGTAWISGNAEADKKEMNALIRLCNKGYVSVACVGSEALLRGDVTAEQLIADIKYVKRKIKDKSIPVTTADTSSILRNNEELRDNCDVLFPNYYPYWGGVSIKKAAADFISEMSMLMAWCPEKELIISETGWPTSGKGGTIGAAVPGWKNAAKYFKEIRKWALKSGTKVMFFALNDENWKSSGEGSVGAHWGILTTKLKLKKAYKNCFTK